MNTYLRDKSTIPLRLSLVTVLLSVAVVFYLAAPASAADDRQHAMQLVEKAHLTLQSFMSDSNMDTFRDLLKQSKAVLIVPQLLKVLFTSLR